MPDQSYLDQRYFVNGYAYNCPFCNRRNVSYFVSQRVQSFNWTEDKTCFVYFVRCSSCDNRSMHLTYTELSVQSNTSVWSRFEYSEHIERLDELFFYSVPTSFFVLDNRIPRPLRELVTEAEGCLKGNFLTGASACIRKVVYELASIEGIDAGNYEERIKSLKEKHSDLVQTYFDTLITIQQLTSDKVHESSYDGWESAHVRLMLASLKEVLDELYVIPAIRADRRKEILELKHTLLNHKK